MYLSMTMVEIIGFQNNLSEVIDNIIKCIV